MSGVVGVWHLDGRRVDEQTVLRLLEPLASRGPDGSGVWAQGSVGLGVARLDRGVITDGRGGPYSSSSGTQLVFDGCLYDRRELGARIGLGSASSLTMSDEELVSRAYDRAGVSFVELLQGDFALGLMDPLRGRLDLARDRLGVRPLYTYRTASSFLFASEIKAFYGHPDFAPAPDVEMTAEWFIGGPPRWDPTATFFANVDCLPASQVMVVEERSVRVKRYWDLALDDRVHTAPFDDLAEELRERFRNAVTRRMSGPGPTTVMVSGGVDSSAIFSVCMREVGAGREVEGITLAGTPSTIADEIAFIEELERHFGKDIHRIPMTVEDPSLSAAVQVGTYEMPLVDDQWAWTERLYGLMRGFDSRSLLTGSWGDQLFTDTTYLVELVDRLALRQLVRHVRGIRATMPWADWDSYRRHLLWDQLRWHVPRPLIPLARRARGRTFMFEEPWVTEEVRRIAREVPKDVPVVSGWSRTSPRSRYFHDYLRGRTHTLYLEHANKTAARHGCDIAFPYLDIDLISFVMGVPGEAVMRDGETRALQRASQRGVVPEVIRTRLSKADFTSFGNAAMLRAVTNAIERIDGSSPSVEMGFVDLAALRRELPRIKGKLGAATLSWEGGGIGKLLGLDSWLQVFFRDKRW